MPGIYRLPCCDWFQVLCELDVPAGEDLGRGLCYACVTPGGSEVVAGSSNGLVLFYRMQCGIIPQC
eukprot:4165139-Pyramimonas_sp.AAC.1